MYEQGNLGRVSINAVEINENVKEDNANEFKANPRIKSSKVSNVFDLSKANTNNKIIRIEQEYHI